MKDNLEIAKKALENWADESEEERKYAIITSEAGEIDMQLYANASYIKEYALVLLERLSADSMGSVHSKLEEMIETKLREEYAHLIEVENEN